MIDSERWEIFDEIKKRVDIARKVTNSQIFRLIFYKKFNFQPALRGHMEYAYAEEAEEATVADTKQKKTKKGEPVKLTEEEKEALRRKRETEIQNNPYYVKVRKFVLSK